MALLMSQQRGELEREGGGIDRPLQKHKSDFQIQALTTYLPKPTPSRQNTSESFFYHGCWGIWPHKSTFTLLRPKSNTFSATKPGFCRWTATPILRIPHNFEDTDDHSTFTCILISPVCLKVALCYISLLHIYDIYNNFLTCHAHCTVWT